MTKVEEAMVLERAPEVRIAKNEMKKDFDAPSTSATTMNEKEILGTRSARDAKRES